MKVKDHNAFRLFEYENHPNPNFELGDVVIKIDRTTDVPNPEDGNPIGVVIQTHSDGDCRTDQFGNCCTEEVRKATYQEIEQYRNELCEDLEDLFETYETLPENVRAVLKEFEDMDLDYENCRLLISALNEVGYSCEYGLCGVPHTLHKIDMTVTIETSDYSQVTGKVVKIRENSIDINQGNGIKGVEVIVWYTVVDEKGKEWMGILAKK